MFRFNADVINIFIRSGLGNINGAICKLKLRAFTEPDGSTADRR